MTAGHNDRRLVKIRRRGRHSTPSQVERVAVQAGKAAPAVAIAGALVAVPGAQHAFAAQDTPATVTTQTHEAGQADRAAHKGTRVGDARLDLHPRRHRRVDRQRQARGAGQVQPLHGPQRRHAVEDRRALLRQGRRLGLPLPRERQDDLQPEPDLRRREPVHPGHRARRLQAQQLRAEARRPPAVTATASVSTSHHSSSSSQPRSRAAAAPSSCSRPARQQHRLAPAG